MSSRWLNWIATSLLVGPWLVPPVLGPSPAVVGIIFATVVTAAYIWFTVASHGIGKSLCAIELSWLIAGLVSAFAALCQYFGITESMNPWVSHAEIGEAFANLRQRNQFATLTNMALAVLLVSSRPNAENYEDSIARSAMIVLLVAANAASASRTGFLQLCALVVMSIGLRDNTLAFWRNRAALTAVVAYSVSAFVFLAIGELQQAGGGILARAQDSALSCSGRLVLWSNVLHLITQKPWLGWGWGELSHAHFITLYPHERFCEILDNAHNLPLQLAVELGVPVALAVCGASVWWVVRNKPWAEVDATRQLAWAVLAIIALHSLLEYPLWYGPFQMAVVLCLVLLKCNPKALSQGAPAPGFASPNCEPEGGLERLFSPIVAARMAIVVIALCAYAGWDYWRISQLYLASTARTEVYRDDTHNKVKGTWLFQNQVQFAELTTTTLTASNASAHYAEALRLLHFSPEPRVVEAAIESAVLLGQDQEALYYLQRYKAAFPDAHAQWAARSERFKAP